VGALAAGQNPTWRWTQASFNGSGTVPHCTVLCIIMGIVLIIAACSEDKFPEWAPGVVLTGRGYPDFATRLGNLRLCARQGLMRVVQGFPLPIVCSVKHSNPGTW